MYVVACFDTMDRVEPAVCSAAPEFGTYGVSSRYFAARGTLLLEGSRLFSVLGFFQLSLMS